MGPHVRVSALLMDKDNALEPLPASSGGRVLTQLQTSECPDLGHPCLPSALNLKLCRHLSGAGSEERKILFQGSMGGQELVWRH